MATVFQVSAMGNRLKNMDNSAEKVMLTLVVNAGFRGHTAEARNETMCYLSHKDKTQSSPYSAKFYHIFARRH